MTCTHPFESLEIDAGGSGRRGAAHVQVVRCGACGETFSGVASTRLAMEAAIRDVSDLWLQVEALGGSRRALSVAPARSAPAPSECAHYLPWLLVTGSDARGSSGTAAFRCAGCKRGWSQGAGVKVFLDRLRDELRPLRDELKRLERGRRAEDRGA